MITLEQITQEIYPGWKNLVFRDPEIEKIALRRIEVCHGCEKLNRAVWHKKYGRKCGVCGCPVEAKVRSMSSKCPIDKWGVEHIR